MCQLPVVYQQVIGTSSLAVQKSGAKRNSPISDPRTDFSLAVQKSGAERNLGEDGEAIGDSFM